MDRLATSPAANKAPGVPTQPDKSAPVQANDEPAQPTVHETNKIWLIAGLALGAFAFSRAVL